MRIKLFIGVLFVLLAVQPGKRSRVPVLFGVRC